VVVDLLALVLTGASRRTVGRWFRLGVVTVSAFIAVQGMWAVWAFSALPRGDALDFLWPSYVLEAFAVWPSERRWPRWEGVRYFVGQQLMVVTSAALGVAVLASVIRGRRQRRSLRDGGLRWNLTAAHLRLVLPFAFFAIGAVALFRSVYHFHQYAWTLALTAALAVDRGSAWIRRAFTVLCLPGLALLLRANLMTDPPPDAATIRTANGGTLVVTPAGKHRVDALVRYAAADGGTSLLIMRTGAGFHALFDTRFSGRQFFYILGFARGRDDERMLQTLESGPAAIVLIDYPPNEVPSADPCTWYGWPHFRADFCPRLAKSVNVGRAVQIDPTTWIIPAAGMATQARPRDATATPGR
jgi:hypothetical protein